MKKTRILTISYWSQAVDSNYISGIEGGLHAGASDGDVSFTIGLEHGGEDIEQYIRVYVELPLQRISCRYSIVFDR